jgi:hypothetical protein
MNRLRRHRWLKWLGGAPAFQAGGVTGVRTVVGAVFGPPAYSGGAPLPVKRQREPE